MSNNGYVYAYRKAWTHEVFNDLLEAAIWNFLYQNAFWKDGIRNFNGYTFNVKRGQIITSISFLAKGFRTSEKGVRTVIQKLEKHGMIGVQGASRGTIITICNYEEYQSNQKTEGEQNGNRGATEGRAEGENKKEVNKYNKDKELIYAEFSEFWKIYPKARAGSKEKAFAAFAKKAQKHGSEAILSAVKKYAASDEVAKGFAKGCAAWLNDDRFLNEYAPLRKETSIDKLRRQTIGYVPPDRA